MKRDDSYSLGQLLALCTVAVLTPALRLLPSETARLAGRGGWFSVLLALPAAAAYGWILRAFAGKRREGESLASLWRRAAGERAGALLLALTGLWLLFYAGFSLRAGAERLVTTVYPAGKRAVFALSMGLIAALAGAGGARALARMAKLVLPLLIGAIALTLAFAVPEIHADNLLPLAARDAPALLRGALPTLDAAGLALTLLFFLSDGLSGPAPYRAVAARIALLGSLMSALVAAVTGVFGHELSAALTRPFFSLVRNLVFFRSLERIEALVVTLWLFSDFLLVAALLNGARRCLRPLLGERVPLAPLCALASLFLGVLLAPDAQSYARLSLRWIPALNFGFCLLPPGIFALGALRKKL